MRESVRTVTLASLSEIDYSHDSRVIETTRWRGRRIVSSSNNGLTFCSVLGILSFASKVLIL